MWKCLTYGNWNASVFAASFERKSVAVFEPISYLAKFSNRLYSEPDCFPSSFGWKSVAIFGLEFHLPHCLNRYQTKLGSFASMPALALKV